MAVADYSPEASACWTSLILPPSVRFTPSFLGAPATAVTSSGPIAYVGSQSGMVFVVDMPTGEDPIKRPCPLRKRRRYGHRRRHALRAPVWQAQCASGRFASALRRFHRPIQTPPASAPASGSEMESSTRPGVRDSTFSTSLRTPRSPTALARVHKFPTRLAPTCASRFRARTRRHRSELDSRRPPPHRPLHARR